MFLLAEGKALNRANRAQGPPSAQGLSFFMLKLQVGLTTFYLSISSLTLENHLNPKSRSWPMAMPWPPCRASPHPPGQADFWAPWARPPAAWAASWAPSSPAWWAESSRAPGDVGWDGVVFGKERFEDRFGRGLTAKEWKENWKELDHSLKVIWCAMRLESAGTLGRLGHLHLQVVR